MSSASTREIQSFSLSAKLENSDLWVFLTNKLQKSGTVLEAPKGMPPLAKYQNNAGDTQVLDRAPK